MYKCFEFVVILSQLALCELPHCVGSSSVKPFIRCLQYRLGVYYMNIYTRTCT